MKGSAFLSLILAALLTAGCSGEKKDQKTPDVVPAENTQRETKTTTTGENDHGARIEFVTREHKMERVLFSGGYLRSLPEESPTAIVREVPQGSEGMIYGKRVLGKKEWAKVTTRDGVTGWYTIPETALKAGQQATLEELSKVHRSTYPQIIGGVASDVALAINREIGRYLDVYRFVTGPVGSDLSCHVTYNRRNILSFYFSGPPIRYRAYSVKSINDGPSWKEVERYAFVSPLWGGADPRIMTSAVTDIQYAMTFDLASGRRLTLSDFIGKENLAKARALVEAFGGEAAFEEDNFYVDDKGQLFLFAERTQPQPGREALNLSRLVVRDY